MLYKKLTENPFTGLQWFKKRVDNNIDDVSLNEANVFFDWYTKNEVTFFSDFYYLQIQPWSIVEKILETKIAYLENNLDDLSLDEVLDWLNHNQSLIQLGGFSCNVKRIRKTILVKKIKNPLTGLPWFKQRFDKDIVNLDEVNMFFDWYNENGKDTPKAVEIVELGKQKMLAKVLQETTAEANELMLTYSWLEELLPEGKKILVGKGKSGIVVMSKKPNTVIKIIDLLEKITLDKQLEQLQMEVKIHNKFRQAIELGKIPTADGSQAVPGWAHAPQIRRIIDPTAPNARGRAYIMERVPGVTLKRWVYLKLDEYRSTLEPFMEQEIQHISEIEFEKLLKKRKANINVYQTFVNRDKGELIPEIFSKAFPEKMEGLQHTLEYLRENYGLIHPDLHWKNILIDDQEHIYLIDFAP